jgi:hypothetical protein
MDRDGLRTHGDNGTKNQHGSHGDLAVALLVLLLLLTTTRGCCDELRPSDDVRGGVEEEDGIQ